MSQVKFNTRYRGKPVRVMAGWDDPLQYYHFTIFDLDPEAEEEIIYSELDHLGFPRSIEPLKEVLASYNITPPYGFWDLAIKKLGNICWDWDDGEDKWEMHEI